MHHHWQCAFHPYVSLCEATDCHIVVKFPIWSDRSSCSCRSRGHVRLVFASWITCGLEYSCRSTKHIPSRLISSVWNPSFQHSPTLDRWGVFLTLVLSCFVLLHSHNILSTAPLWASVVIVCHSTGTLCYGFLWEHLRTTTPSLGTTSSEASCRPSPTSKM